jgi:adenylylsulfate kinase
MDPAATNITRAPGSVDADVRQRMFGHSAATVWFTGLSGSGKTTLAQTLEARLVSDGVAAYALDGDNVRFGLNRDLGFSPDDRQENIRRVGEVCGLMVDAGLIVLSAFISPYRIDRDAVRAKHADGRFFEVHVATPLSVCESRDAKGLYARARTGEIKDFSGISAPYEEPLAPELRLDASQLSVEEGVELVLDLLRTQDVLPIRA